MAYNLERFGTLTLPELNPRFSLDTVPAKNTIVKTIAGGFDTAGDGQADMDLPQPVTFRGVLYDRDLGLWRTAVDALRGESRKRARLWRRACDNDEVQWCYARFLSSRIDRDFQNPFEYDARLTFLQQTGWVGHDHRTWTLDDGEYLDTGLYLDDEGYEFDIAGMFSVINGGNRATSNVVLTITAGSAHITALTIACGDAELTYDAAILATESLVIDCGAQSILNDGDASYQNLDLTSNHEIEEWIRLEPGSNSMTVTKTGGGTGSTLLVEFEDGWE